MMKTNDKPSETTLIHRVRRALTTSAVLAAGLMMTGTAAGQEAGQPLAPVGKAGEVGATMPDNPAKPAADAAGDAASPDSAPAGVVIAGPGADGKLALTVNKGQVLKTNLPYKTINIANPDIADINRVNEYEIMVTAKKPGSTQITLWDVSGLSQTIDVNVGTDLERLQGQLDKIFPGAGIQATNVNGTIALRGRVKSLEIAEQAIAVATPYSGNVLNFLEIAGGQQVMLQVRFAEVSRSASTQLGFSAFGTDGRSQLGYVNGPNGNPIGAVAGLDPEAILNPAVTIFGAGKLGGVSFEYFVQALRRNNLLRVLAEPNLIAISGEPASFLAGGEFPVPVPQSRGGGTTITIEYKQFGVKLNFVPLVLGDGKIRLKVEPEVSDLDFTRSVSLNGFSIPSLTKRTVSTTIELSEGQTFAVAGLLNNRIVASKDVTPLLGDLPIIGALFRSTRFERSETELVVLVTPHLVEPMNPGQVGKLPGENFTDPTELQMLLDAGLGTTGQAPLEAKDEEAMAGADGAAGEPARFKGQYGFVPAAAMETMAESE